MTSITLPPERPLQRSITSYENHGAFRWNKPAFQAFQLRPWNKDPEIAESLKSSLGIYGPHSHTEVGRAKSVPVRHSKEGSIVDRNDVRTAHSVANMCDLISMKPKSSLEALPVRPPLSKTKQVPGRYFPKAMPIDAEKVINFNMFKRYKPPVRIRNIERPIGNSKSLDMQDIPVESTTFVNANPRSSRQKSPIYGRQFYRMKRQATGFPEIKSEVFAISFSNNAKSRKPEEGTSGQLNDNVTPKSGNPEYDPNSELHSDYYTIKRLSVATTASKASAKAFSVVLRGLPKRLHPKLMLANGMNEFVDDGYIKEIKSFSGSAEPSLTLREAPDSEVKETTHMPSVSSGAGKLKVKIDGGMSLGPIMINGLS